MSDMEICLVYSGVFFKKYRWLCLHDIGIASARSYITYKFLHKGFNKYLLSDERNGSWKLIVFNKGLDPLPTRVLFGVQLSAYEMWTIMGSKEPFILGLISSSHDCLWLYS